MNKIRVVQMMAVASGDEQDWRYLDDKGRVWYQGLSGDWYQLPMPNEPQESPGEREASHCSNCKPSLKQKLAELDALTGDKNGANETLGVQHSL